MATCGRPSTTMLHGSPRAEKRCTGPCSARRASREASGLRHRPPGGPDGAARWCGFGRRVPLLGVGATSPRRGSYPDRDRGPGPACYRAGGPWGAGPGCSPRRSPPVVRHGAPSLPYRSPRGSGTARRPVRPVAARQPGTARGDRTARRGAAARARAPVQGPAGSGRPGAASRTAAPAGAKGRGGNSSGYPGVGCYGDKTGAPGEGRSTWRTAAQPEAPPRRRRHHP